jgi:serine/threonine protein kinase
MTGVDSLLTVGRYGIDEWLASDAMGVMFRGRDPVIERPVAIKIVRRELTKGSAAAGWLDRFKRKARAGGQLFHPNILTLLDYGEEDEMPFVVMECAHGHSLDVLAKKSGPLAPKRATAIILQVLSALEFSHDNGILHLDLRPSVVFIQSDDKVKIADFGIAQTEAAELAESGDFSGAPTHLAPEQLAGARVDHRADLFSAGVVLFELLTGTTPFFGKSVTDILAQMEADRPEDVCVLNPEVAVALRNVVDIALAYDPARRFATAGAFAQALAEAVPLRDAARTAVVAPPSSPGAGKTAPPSHETGWDPEILRMVEADLATHIGPVASIAVKRASKQATDVGDLYEVLSSYIEDGEERGEFIAKSRRVARDMAERETSSPREGLTFDAQQQHDGPAEVPDPAVLEAIEARLAQSIGPIARVLLKQELRHSGNVPELCRALADHISDDAERAAFLNWAGAR